MTLHSPAANDRLTLYGEHFNSRLLLGTSRYPSPRVMQDAMRRAQPAMMTASLRRQGAVSPETSQSFWQMLKELSVPVLPNTAGCHSPQEAITTAQMAREVFETDWIKLELIGDDYTLQPDTLQLVQVAATLIRDGFKVLPYCTEDLILCQRLVDVVRGVRCRQIPDAAFDDAYAASQQRYREAPVALAIAAGHIITVVADRG